MKTVAINHQVLPAIGIGTWHLGDQPQQQAKEIAAIRLGIEMGAQLILLKCTVMAAPNT